MTASFPSAFRRLIRAKDESRAREARELVGREVPWETWLGAFNEVHVTRPEAEARAAAALAAAAGRARRPAEAARFRLLEGRGLQRSGSPAAAARALERAASGLRATDDLLRAAQADVLRVDALAMAGRPGEALALAEAARGDLRGPAAVAWRCALEVNRGNALRVQGDLQGAVRVYDRAARRLARGGDLHTAAIARTNAGTALMDAGDAAGAGDRFREAVVQFEKAGQTDMALEAEYNLAASVVRAGELGRGITLLEQSREAAEARELGRRTALASMDLADAFLRAGDRREAERRALGAADHFARERARAERVEALWMAATAAAPQDPRRAAEHLARAERAARRSDRPGLQLRCDLLREDLRRRRGQPLNVRKLGTLRRRALGLGQTEAAAECLLLLAQADLDRGRTRDARRRFGDRSLRRPGRPWLRVAADTGAANADRALGLRGSALARLRRVCADLDRVRAGLPGPWLRTAFVLERLDPYLSRVDLLLERGRAADRSEAEALLDALAARRFLERRRSSADMRSDVTVLRRRLEAIYDALARGSGPTRGIGLDERGRLSREAARLERAVAERWRNAERRRQPGQVVDTAHPTRAELPDVTTALHLWRDGDRIRGLTRVGDRVVAHSMLGDVGALEGDLRLLAFHAARARRSPAGREALGTLREDLSSRLLDPLQPEAWTERVLLVADPQLPDAPWELMVRGAGRTPDGVLEVLRVPAHQMRRPARRSGRGLQVIALGETDLPAVGREAAGISGSVPVLTGSKATRQAVASALATREVVHLAGHGFEARDAPGLGGVRVADGWFGADDVPAHVTARLVVLAACRTGRETGPAGLAWGGLPAALLAAGAHHVLWTADDVEDDRTADLMERFHRSRARRPVARAFLVALEEAERHAGHPGGLLPFRLSGVSA